MLRWRGLSAASAWATARGRAAMAARVLDNEEQDAVDDDNSDSEDDEEDGDGDDERRAATWRAVNATSGRRERGLAARSASNCNVAGLW